MAATDHLHPTLFDTQSEPKPQEPPSSTGVRRAAFYAGLAQQYGFRDEGKVYTSTGSTGRW